MAPGYDPFRHGRRSLPLANFDYRRAGAYFVTVCIDDRQPRLGQIVDGRMALNEAGQMVETHWRSLPDRFPDVDIDTFVVMPNHLHGIVVFVGAPLVGAPESAPTTRAATRAAPTWAEDPSLGEVMGAFKSLTTNAYIHGVRHHGWPPFDRRLWQRNYHERVIRDEDELARLRRYIQTIRPAGATIPRTRPTGPTMTRGALGDASLPSGRRGPCCGWWGVLIGSSGLLSFQLPWVRRVCRFHYELLAGYGASFVSMGRRSGKDRSIPFDESPSVTHRLVPVATDR